MNERNIKKVLCKSILNKSGILDYCINPYTGCEHGCVYCYARFMKRYSNHREEWGDFVDIKVNAVDILKKQLEKQKKGEIFISSVTDAYQPIEKKTELTRNILKELLNYQFPITIQTKSSLVLRDIDLLKKFKDCEVGFTVTCFDEDSVNFEPNASSTEERLRALKILKEEGIKTYIFFGPILPLISTKNLDKLFDEFKAADHILIDKLNIKCGNWPKIEKVIKSKYPDLLDRYKEIFFTDNDYYEKLRKEIIKLCKKRKIKYEFIY